MASKSMLNLGNNREKLYSPLIILRNDLTAFAISGACVTDVTTATFFAPIARTCLMLDSFMPPITVNGIRSFGAISAIAEGPRKYFTASLVSVGKIGPILT